MKNAYLPLLFFVALFGGCKPWEGPDQFPHPTPVDPILADPLPLKPSKNVSVFVTSYKGSLYALDAETGLEQWNTVVGNSPYVNPSVNGETVYSTGKNYSPNVILHALDRKTGAVKWTVKNELSFNLSYPFFLTPTLVGETAIVLNGRENDGQGDAFVVALDALTGQRKWAFPTNLHSDFTVSNGIVYLASGNLQALSVLTGSVLWTFKLPLGGFGGMRPAIADGVIYASDGNGKLYAIDGRERKLKWTIGINGYSEGPPVVNNGIVYISTYEGAIYALDALTGTQRWSFKTTRLRRGPVVADGIVYIGAASGNVYALDANTGEQRWLFKSPDDLIPAESQSSPIIANGVAYFVSGSSRLYALNAKTGEQKWVYQTDSKLLSSPCVVDANGTGFNPLPW